MATYRRPFSSTSSCSFRPESEVGRGHRRRAARQSPRKQLQASKLAISSCLLPPAWRADLYGQRSNKLSKHLELVISFHPQIVLQWPRHGSVVENDRNDREALVAIHLAVNRR